MPKVPTKHGIHSYSPQDPQDWDSPGKPEKHVHSVIVKAWSSLALDLCPLRQLKLTPSVLLLGSRGHAAGRRRASHAVI